MGCRETLQALPEKNSAQPTTLKKKRRSPVICFDTIPINDNILRTSKDIRCNYVPYETGAYAMGEFKPFIPYKELRLFNANIQEVDRNGRQ
ncbi:DUF3298 domain-containing protein [Longitalea luteola]|uniref:DUF3298 domain-containing protein n=1 Tax=Longitalea luteola TaxID=2812563 RepID=UPI0034E2E9C1